MSRVIANIEGEDITERDGSSVHYRAKAAIDTDGSGPHHGDRCAEDGTSLLYRGQPLDADQVRYTVVPPAIVSGVRGVVLGCQVVVRNTRNGLSASAVVGDIGPHRKLGEISVALARALGINPSPTSGGEDEHVIEYVLFPGLPAVLDGIGYDLQPAK